MDAQTTANALGAKMREVDTLAAGTPAETAAGELHTMLAQAFVDFYPDLDWDAVAGIDTEAAKGVHTDGGTKTKPPVSE